MFTTKLTSLLIYGWTLPLCVSSFATEPPSEFEAIELNPGERNQVIATAAAASDLVAANPEVGWLRAERELATGHTYVTVVFKAHRQSLATAAHARLSCWRYSENAGWDCNNVSPFLRYQLEDQDEAISVMNYNWRHSSFDVDKAVWELAEFLRRRYVTEATYQASELSIEDTNIIYAIHLWSDEQFTARMGKDADHKVELTIVRDNSIEARFRVTKAERMATSNIPLEDDSKAAPQLGR